jgi:hypothetical protein
LFLKKKDFPGGAKSVDPVRFLPEMWDAVWNKDVEKSTLVEKILRWVTVLLMFNHFLRPSEVLQYCYLVAKIVLPDKDSDYDATGLPKFMKLSFDHCKGRKNVGEYDMYVWRNHFLQKVTSFPDMTT